MEEGAKFIRNIALMGAFWSGVILLVTRAEAQGIYESEGSVTSVSISPGMNPSTVPQSEVNVQSGSMTTESGNANQGGVQVQNVTVQAGAQADSSSLNGAEALSKIRSNTESANNSLLLQQLELDRLKAEQNRIGAINSFGSHLNSPPAAALTSPTPCGIGPCVPAAPLVEAPAQPVTEPLAVSPVIAVEEEVAVESHSTLFKNWGISPILGMRWFEGDSTAKISNQYLVGVGVSSQLSPYVSAYANFIYGDDKIEGFDLPGGMGYWHTSQRDSYELAVGAAVGYKFNYFRPFIDLSIGSLIQSYEWSNSGETTYNFESNLGAGLDFMISKSFSVGIRGDYQFVFGSGDDAVYGYDLNHLFGDNEDRYRFGATGTIYF